MVKMTSRICGGNISYKNISDLWYNEECSNEIEDVMENAMHDISENYQDYEFDGFPLNFIMRGDDLNYNISTYVEDNRVRISSRGIAKNSDINSLAADLPVFFGISSGIIDSVYGFYGNDECMTMVPDYPMQRTILVRPRHRDGEEAPASIKKVSFDEIGGCEEAKSELKFISFCIDNPQAVWDWGVSYKEGVLLYGPPGTGKTLLARAAATEMNAAFYPVRPSQITSKWYGEAEKNMRKVFTSARSNEPSVLFFDELDSLALDRDNSHEATTRVIATMLDEMDGIVDVPKVLVIGATNRLHAVDQALLRPGRFGKKIEVPLPDEKSLADIYRIKLRGRMADEDIDLLEIARKSRGLSGADVEFVIDQAARKKIITLMDGSMPSPISKQDIADSLEKYIRKRACMGVRDASESFVGYF